VASLDGGRAGSEREENGSERVKNGWLVLVIPLVVFAVWYVWSTYGPETKGTRENRARADAADRAYWRERDRLEAEAAARRDFEREAAAKRFEREVDETE
jgi:hypothetical protein